MLTKSDYLRYLEAPLHLWAEKHQELEISTPSPIQQFLLEQGYQVENLAIQFLKGILSDRYSQPEIMHQKTLSDGHFQARVDVVVYDRDAQVCDLYEVKSSTGVRVDHLEDAAFQLLVGEASLRVRDVFLVYLDKTYTRGVEINLEGLFILEEITAAVRERLPEVRVVRDAAWEVSENPIPDGIPGCSKPKTCPCLTLCHPELPTYPIYDLPRLSKKASMSLLDKGVFSIRDIPDDFPLSDKHRKQRTAVTTRQPYINHDAIRTEFEKLTYPLHFLDFETCNPAIPIFTGYHPYQHVVFQFSLHTLRGPGDEMEHHHFLSTQCEDPTPGLLAHLQECLGDSGSVVVWSQAFEASRIREMAEHHPSWSGFLSGVIARMVDLMQLFSKGAYIHPDFHGSASLKTVLPVMVPDFEGRYSSLVLSDGAEAMAAWLKIVSGGVTAAEIQRLEKALLEYCALDTLAMVEIWQVLSSLI